MSEREDMTADLVALDRDCVWHPFTQMQQWCQEDPLIIAGGEGPYLIDTAGRRYLDAISSLWVNVHGHRVPEIDAAIRAQLDQVAHTTLLGFANVPATRLARRLLDLAPERLTKVFYSDDGSTAVEVALKMAYQYWRHRGQPQRRAFIKMTNAYHGDTIGSVSVGGMAIFHAAFGGLLFDTIESPYPHPYRYADGDAEACSAACLRVLRRHLEAKPGQIIGVVVEPLVQGAAGMIISPPGFLRELEALCRAHDTLLICDEVATGFGRTGRMFAVEHEGVQPDLMTVAKGLTGGYLPVAATLTSQAIYDAFLGDYGELKTFFHGHSYTGNPLGCAAALASLDLFETRGTLAQVRRLTPVLADLLDTRIRPLAHVGDIRQLGFMVGVELVRDRCGPDGRPVDYPWEEQVGVRVCRRARDYGMIQRPLGNVLVLMPPLCCGESELTEMVETLRRCILDITEGDG